MSQEPPIPAGGSAGRLGVWGNGTKVVYVARTRKVLDALVRKMELLLQMINPFVCKMHSIQEGSFLP